MATENKVSGKKYRILVDAVNDIWDRVSFWTSAKDVEFEDGTSLEDAKQSFGKGMLQRNTVYHVGDIAYTNAAPSWVQLKCTVTGTTAIVEPTATYAAIDTQGMSVIDGTASFEVNDVRVATSLSDSLNQPASVGLVNQHVQRLDAKMGDLSWYIKNGYLPAIPQDLSSTNLDDCTWEEINSFVQGGTMRNYFDIGDIKKIKFPTGEVVEMQIADFDHDGTKGTVDFISKNCMKTPYAYNSGRWDDSALKKALDNTVWSYLPEDLKQCIIPKRVQLMQSNSWIWAESEDKLWLPTAYEIFGNCGSYVHSSEADNYVKYPLFDAKYGGTVKHVEKSSLGLCNWWTRSRSYKSDGTYWKMIDTNGNLSEDNYPNAFYIPLCFRLGFDKKETPGSHA